MKKFLLLIGLFLLTACSVNEADFKSTVPVRGAIEEQMGEQIGQSAPQFDPRSALPSEINLDVPFYPQAPDADWSLPWQEACEEASITLAYYYATGQDLNKELFKSKILELVDWENEQFGDYQHTTIKQTAKILNENFEFPNFQILNNPTIENLKTELAQGHIIVAPFAGRRLGNPFFSGEGPYYHMMVIKGYDDTHFITNDVGTRRGENFIYPYETIMNALHDWNEKNILLGRKEVIIVRPN